MNASGILLLFLNILFSLPVQHHPFVGQCLAVIDGDTIYVSRDGITIRILVEGIDCPEKNQPFAEEAKAFTLNLITGKTVTIVEKEKDSYGRTVARVFVDGRDRSMELLKAGLAAHFKQYNSDWLLAALEEQAKADKVGMWASANAVPLAENPPPTLPLATSQSASGIQESTQVVYHGNVKSRVFHATSCMNYNCKNCTRELRSREEAVAA